MDVYEVTEIKRPRGLVPGSREWLTEIEGPRLITRLVDEVHAGEVGAMTPTQARCAAMLLDRFAPTMSAVHHTVEGTLGKMSEAEILAELERLTTKPALPAPEEDTDAIEAELPPAPAAIPEPAEPVKTKKPRKAEKADIDAYPSGKGYIKGSRKNRGKE